ncbi:hypothetical protein IV203_020892 [Nitzschia inconspicua]|uniref:Uncharacterized protein n=1 Tax=Nitzschia inconspicua TaxID=303405 RepID=A0A9K3KFV3_9STRA|nr:hypothetical protein IV203_020892 [Nitzschia inconspicua]
MRPLEQPVPIANPNGALMYATHEAELPIPSLPLSAHRVYVVPELASSPLIAVAPLCDAGCTVTFANTTVTVHLGHDLLLMGSRDPTSGLWHVTLPPPAELAAATIDHQTGPADLVAFAHAALFSPALSTLHEALRLGYVTGIPGLTAETLRRHPPSSIATTKGHLDQTRMNLRSTKPSIPLPSADDTADCFPPLTLATKALTNVLLLPSNQLAKYIQRHHRQIRRPVVNRQQLHSHRLRL